MNLTYDGERHQTQTMEGASGPTTNYLFDALGERVQKQVVVNGATTVYVHDAYGQLAAEYDSASVAQACVTCYLTYDQVGSVRLITDQSANVVARHDYVPYGEEILAGEGGRTAADGFGNNANVTQRFTGQERDGGTATLDYFNARQFSAVMGSFLQPDPGNAGADITNPQSWNAYAYVLGNPLRSVEILVMDANIRRELIDTLLRFLSREGDDREWDDFLSVKQNDPTVREVQGFSRQLRDDYPPDTAFEWCNEHGREALWEVVKRLQQS